ncbi:DUF5590 domain-containing protein [Pseudogracilibacillus auburnensis]|uniref:Uncharacterized protein YpmB n=1 Tax=Pseudogracilibacillus auburnensis TaxID=1494959 RepID=A0A2V3W465_9BACI|nr:DUF5590 domain-containing protein [Pseudogracilibacillus auburnensis]PXW88770.1 uncharacterized protein YpmB [Pseudogracilibacillus auburnensis]
MKEKLKWISWKRVIIICTLILFIFLIIYFISFLRYIDDSKLVDFDATEQIIYDKTDLTAIDDAYHFQEENEYHIVFGHDSDGEEWIAFVPLSKKTIKKDDIVVIRADSVLTREQIENNWLKECKQCTLTGSTPAMINQQPLWELSYTDNANRYVIEYVSLKDGTTYEQMRLIRKYNTKG